MKRLWLWLPPLAFLGIFFFFPLAAVFTHTLEGIAGQDIASLTKQIGDPLGFTIWQAALSTILTLFIGLPAAFVFGRFKFRGKRFLQAATTLPFILPTVVVAAGFNALIGPRGWVNLVLMEWFTLAAPPVQLLNSLGAILLAHVFYNTTIIIRMVGSAWASLDPRLEHAGRVLGASAWRNFWEVTLPLLWKPILAAVLLVFLFDFTSFGVILLLGGPRFATLEVEIYTQTMVFLNLPLAALLSAVQLGFSLLITILYTRMNASRAIAIIPRLKGEGLRRVDTWRERLLVWGVIVLLVLLLVTPLLALAGRSVARLEADRGDRGSATMGFTLEFYRELFINRRGGLFYVPPAEAAWNSLRYGGLTVVLSLAMGYLTVFALRRRNRFSRFMDAMLMLPLGTSAVTLGLGMLLVFSRPPLDVRTFPLIVPIAHSLVAFPFVVRTLQPALDAIPGSLRNAAAVLGASPWRVWREVDLPLMARAGMVSAVFAFTISLGEFGATSFLARPETPTLPVAIYRFLSQPGAMNYGQAMAMATLLMLVCGISIFIIDREMKG